LFSSAAAQTLDVLPSRSMLFDIKPLLSIGVVLSCTLILQAVEDSQGLCPLFLLSAASNPQGKGEHRNSRQELCPTIIITTTTIMASHSGDDNQYTTNEEDQRKAAALKASLRKGSGSAAETGNRLASVRVADGRHKYVLISAEMGGDVQYFVTSRKGAHYHIDAAEPMVADLKRSGYTNINVTGGGRILLDHSNKKMEIYGHSYGFGLADHAKSRETVLSDPSFKDYDISISNDGY
jgi:Janus/Ocnus family (Ocnus)